MPERLRLPVFLLGQDQSRRLATNARVLGVSPARRIKSAVPPVAPSQAAMARASIGIAMGAAGSDAAIEAADIALMSDDLSKLPWLIRRSRRTLRIIKENITVSIAVKALFVALTFAGYASLWAAIAADMGVSLLVIFNALRLLNTGSSEHSVA
jgi:hypothetical protein